MPITINHNGSKRSNANFKAIETRLSVVETQTLSGLKAIDIVDDLITGGSSKVLSAEQGKNLKNEINNINVVLGSDDISLDSVQEVVNYIKNIKAEFDALLVNDLTTGGTLKALTAEQGKVLKGLIDALQPIVNSLVAQRKMVYKSSSATLTADEGNTLFILTSIATVTLPEGTAQIDGVIYTIGNDSSSSENLTVVASGGLNIESDSSIVLEPTEKLSFAYNHSLNKWIEC